MSEIQVINGQASATQQSALDHARIDFVEGLGKTGDLQRKYASEIKAAFGAEWWNATGETKKLVKAEHQAFIELAQTRLNWTRANVDKVWSRIKDESGRVKQSAPRVSGGDDIDAKTTAEIKTMLGRIYKVKADDNLAPMSKKVLGLLEEIADQLGIDIEKI